MNEELTKLYKATQKISACADKLPKESNLQGDIQHLEILSDKLLTTYKQLMEEYLELTTELINIGVLS